MTDSSDKAVQPQPAGAIATALGLVDWRTDGAGIELTFRGNSTIARWDEITSGGLVRTGNASTGSASTTDLNILELVASTPRSPTGENRIRPIQYATTPPMDHNRCNSRAFFILISQK